MGKNIPQLYLEKCLFSHLSLCLSPAKSFYSSSQSGSQQQHIITRGVPIRSCGYRLDRNQMLHPDQGSYISIYRVRVSSLCLTLYLCLYLCLYLSIWVHVILHDNVRNMKKAVDDMEVLSVCCVSHALQLAVHKGLLSQCSISDSLLSQGRWSANVGIACAE